MLIEKQWLTIPIDRFCVCSWGYQEREGPPITVTMHDPRPRTEQDGLTETLSGWEVRKDTQKQMKGSQKTKERAGEVISTRAGLNVKCRKSEGILF